MRIITILTTLSLSWTALTLDLPPGIPRSLTEFRQKHPYSHPHHTTRKQVHLRPSANSTDDISSQFLSALHRANNGGTLVLPANQTFVIGQPLDLTFLSNIHILLDGEILFTNDTTYWQKNAFRHPFQNSIMFWKWGGKNIKIYGKGVLNGNGQRWWNEFSGLEILDPSNTYLRPVLFYAENLTNFEMQGIHLKDSPCWTTFFVDAQHLTLSDVACTAVSSNPTKAPPKNSDFFDSLNVAHVNIQRAWVDIGDDCFSPKSNNTDLVVRDMYCNGTHGISMGSIGQYAGEMSFIKDVHVENMWMLNGQHGARIKSWAGENIGYGFVDNITFRGFWNGGNEYTAFIDSCYFNINATTCAAYPSRVNITNVLFENFTGTSSGKYGNAVGRLTCSPNAVCKNIRFRNFNVTSPCGGPPVVICDGISEDMGIQCVSSTSAAARAALENKCSSGLATLPTSLPWGSVP